MKLNTFVLNLILSFPLILLSANFGHAEQQYHVIQVGSYPNMTSALNVFNKAQKSTNVDSNSYLRVEEIGRYHTVRIGKFETYKEALKLFQVIKDEYVDSFIMRAYYRPGRIKKLSIHQSAQLDHPAVEDDVSPSATLKTQETDKYESPDMVVADKEYYTLQLSSLPSEKSARQEFKRVQSKLTGSFDSYLRVEKIGTQFAIRLGKFDNFLEAKELHAELIKQSFQSLILSAFIKPSRIIVQAEHAMPSSPIAIKESVTDQQTAVDQQKMIDKAVEVVEQETPSIPAEQFIEEELITEKDEQTSDVLKDDTPSKKEKTDQEPLFTFETLTILNEDDQQDPLNYPSHIFYDMNQHEIYLVNGGNRRIVLYGSDYFAHYSLGDGRNIESAVSGVVDDDGLLYICQASTDLKPSRLTILNGAFYLENEITFAKIPHAKNFIPQRVAIGKDNLIYVVGLNLDETLIFNKNGDFIDSLAVKDEDYEPLKKGADGATPSVPIKTVKTDVHGNIYLLSEETGKVYVYNSNNEFLFSFGQKGGAKGKLSRPRDIAIDEKKRCIYVVDYMRHTILVYDFDGTFRHEFGGKGWSAGWFNFPVSLAIGRDSSLLVADLFNNRIQVIKTTLKEEFPERSAVQWQL